MADIQETIADIIAEMRECDGWRAYYDGGLHHDSYDVDVVDVDYLHDFANRLEAAHKREMSKNASKNGADFGQLGDCAKLREAVVRVLDWLKRMNAQPLNTLAVSELTPSYAVNRTARSIIEDNDYHISQLTAALAAPPRNCDIYLTEEAVDAATGTVRDCTACPSIDMEAPCVYCMVRWLLAPATEKEGGNDAD